MSVSQTRTTGLGAGEDDPRGPIILVDEPRRDEAVQRLVAGSPRIDPDHGRRFMDFAKRNAIDLRAMWSRLDASGRVESTVLVVPNPGRTAMLFATRAPNGDAVEPLGELIDHACRHLGGLQGPLADVHLCQVLIEPGEAREREAFMVGGFQRLADLSYLERPLPGAKLPRIVEWPADARLETYHESNRAMLRGILEASYEDTLDCPGLLGLRSSDDILAGHMGTGDFDPALWTLLHVGERPAGALLLNPSSQGRCVELVYLGLARFARGRGLGHRLLQHGLGLLRGRRERLVMLAVDENNAPAIGLYRGHGFRRVLRRVALIRPLAGVGVETDAS